MNEEVLAELEHMAKQSDRDVKQALKALETYQSSSKRSNDAFEVILKEAVQLAMSSQRLLHAAFANAPQGLGKAELKMLEDHQRESQTYFRAITQKWKRVGNGWETTDGTILDDFGNEVKK